MKTAFIVLKSPQEQDPTRTIEGTSPKGDAIAILVEDGVLQALTKRSAERLSRAVSEILISREDVVAKGFSEKDLSVGRLVDYPEIIDCIMEQSERTVTV